jgi:AraC-like DNA-binding protein
VESKTAVQASYSMRLLVPYLRLLKTYPGFPVEALAPLERLDPDERVPIAHVHALQRAAVKVTGDEDLGLKAAHEITRGDYGALEFAARSAANWGDAIAVIGRYMRLINDSLQFSLVIEGEQAQIHLDSRIVLPRASADFQTAAIYLRLLSIVPPGAAHEFQVWFAHARPERTDQYQRTFGDTALRFAAPFNGFVFSRRFLDAPMAAADPMLHQLISKHAELLLSELPKGESLTERVRDLIAAQLEKGDPSIANIAHQLGTSPRTLGRKLEHEGTTFKQVLDDLRRRLALRYVGNHDLGLAEVAFLLGFSQSAAFHRAFKRWTSQTPLEYRRGRRGQGA